MKKMDKKQIEYMARTIMPELYKCQAVADASMKEFIKRYFGNDDYKDEVKAAGE